MPLTSGGLSTGKLQTGRINDIRKADKKAKKESREDKKKRDKKRAQDARDRDKADRERRRQKDKNLLDQKKEDEEARKDKARDENPAKAPEIEPQEERENGPLKGFVIGAIDSDAVVAFVSAKEGGIAAASSKLGLIAANVDFQLEQYAGWFDGDPEDNPAADPARAANVRANKAIILADCAEGIAAADAAMLVPISGLKVFKKSKNQ